MLLDIGQGVGCCGGVMQIVHFIKHLFKLFADQLPDGHSEKKMQCILFGVTA